LAGAGDLRGHQRRAYQARFAKDSGRNPEGGSGEPGQGCPGTGEIEHSRCGRPKDDPQRSMDLPALALRDHPGGRIVCQKPVSGELSAEGECFGLALVEKPGAQPCQGLLRKRGLQRDDLHPGRLLACPSRIMGEDLRLDRRRNVDSADTTEERERFGFEKMEHGARVADNPYQRSASLRLWAQRMSSR
jgi:hypothetical protein